MAKKKTAKSSTSKKGLFAKHPNLKWLFPILAIVLVMVAIKYSYISSTQHNSTRLPTAQSNLSTYENARYHYAFRYSKDLKIEVGTIGLYNGDSELPKASHIKITSSALPEAKFTAWISAGRNQQYTSLEDFATSLQTTVPGTIEMTKLDGTDALKYVAGQPGAGEVLNIVALKDGYFYQLSLDFSNSVNIPLFNQLISTFKFTD